MPLKPPSIFTILAAPTTPIGIKIKGYNKPTSNSPKNGKPIVVCPALTTIKGTAAERVIKGFCHCFKPEDLSFALLTIKSSTNPTKLIIKIVVIPAKK